MKTDRLDLLQLHSCSLEILEKGEVIQVLRDAQKTGKVRFIGYSEANRSDKPAALWSLNSGIFDTLQTSYHLVDQFSRTQLFPLAEAKNIGVIMKRPIALSVWGRESSQMAMGDEYFRRAQMMKDMGPIEEAPANGVALALGFVYSYPEVDTAILGTGSAGRMEANIRVVNQGVDVPSGVTKELERRFAAIEGNLKPI
jgi:aryl-alcohol dehydrogenase-like predicted oxidoreductase